MCAYVSQELVLQDSALRISHTYVRSFASPALSHSLSLRPDGSHYRTVVNVSFPSLHISNLAGSVSGTRSVLTKRVVLGDFHATLQEEKIESTQGRASEDKGGEALLHPLVFACSNSRFREGGGEVKVESALRVRINMDPSASHSSAMDIDGTLPSLRSVTVL